MNKYKVGDKFEIEIAEVSKGAESGNNKYRIKGFDNLVFDDKGLDKIKKIESSRPYQIMATKGDCSVQNLNRVINNNADCLARLYDILANKKIL